MKDTCLIKPEENPLIAFIIDHPGVDVCLTFDDETFGTFRILLTKGPYHTQRLIDSRSLNDGVPMVWIMEYMLAELEDLIRNSKNGNS